jgi:hypothetical protein
MFVRPPRLLNQQPGSRRQQRWMFVAILPAIHKRQKERADIPHQVTRQQLDFARGFSFLR